MLYLVIGVLLTANNFQDILKVIVILPIFIDAQNQTIRIER